MSIFISISEHILIKTFTFQTRECQKWPAIWNITRMRNTTRCPFHSAICCIRRFSQFLSWPRRKLRNVRGTVFRVFCAKSWIIVERVAPVTRRRWGGRAIRIHSAFLNMIYDGDDEKPTASPLWCIDGIILARFGFFPRQIRPSDEFRRYAVSSLHLKFVSVFTFTKTGYRTRPQINVGLVSI